MSVSEVKRMASTEEAEYPHPPPWAVRAERERQAYREGETSVQRGRDKHT